MTIKTPVVACPSLLKAVRFRPSRYFPVCALISVVNRNRAIHRCSQWVRYERGDLPFIAADAGVAPGSRWNVCLNATVVRVQPLSWKPGYVGAFAFSRSLDPSSGGLSDVKVIRKFGDVPDDLSEL